MGFNNFKDIQDRMNNGLGSSNRFLKVKLYGATGYLLSYWRIEGNPTVGELPPPIPDGGFTTKETLGAIDFESFGVPWIIGIEKNARTNVLESLILYDRIWHASDVDLNKSEPQEINVTLPSEIDPRGVEVMLEVEADSGDTATDIFLTYLNQDNAEKETKIWIPANVPAKRCYLFPLIDGDIGVKGLSSIKTGQTGQGTANLVLIRRICFIMSLSGGTKDFVRQAIMMRRIRSNACLALLKFSTSSAQSILDGKIDIVFET